MPKDDEKNKIMVNDLLDRNLLDSRVIFLFDAIDDESSTSVIKKLWFFELKDPGKPILLVINSPGGSVTSGLAIWDQIKLISSPVTTLVTGLAASMGSVLSLVAPKGRRFATPYSRIMIHQPRIMGTITGQAIDLEIQANEIEKTKSTLVKIYVEATDKTEEEINIAIDRDYWMTVQEAVEYGLIDKIVVDISEIYDAFKNN